MGTAVPASIICSPTRRSVWAGRSTPTRSRRKPKPKARRDNSAPGSLASATGRSCSCSTWFQKSNLSEPAQTGRFTVEGGTRLAIVFSGSPLFSGARGSGEFKIRRWIIENDWLEAIVALPDQLFYNTGIAIYFWVLTNRKRAERRGKIALIDARNAASEIRKSLGDNRNYLSDEVIAEVTRMTPTPRPRRCRPAGQGVR
jgi:hypothetical protein